MDDQPTPDEVETVEIRLDRALDEFVDAGTKDARRELSKTVAGLARELVDETEARTAPPPELEVADAPEAKLIAALAGAQGEFPNIAKTRNATVRVSEAKGGGTYSYAYADIADVLAVVRPILSRHGLAVLQKTVLRDGKVILVTELRHVAGARETSEVDLGRDSSSPQQFGGALTYLRRYELVTLIGLAAEEDRDAQDVEPANGSSAAAAAPSWTRAASEQTKRDALDAMAWALGDRGTAREYLKTLAGKTGGSLPDVVGLWLATIRQWRAAADGARDRAAAAPTEERAGGEATASPPTEEGAPAAPAPRAGDPAASSQAARRMPPPSEFAAPDGAVCGKSYRGSHNVVCVLIPGHDWPRHYTEGGQEFDDDVARDTAAAQPARLGDPDLERVAEQARADTPDVPLEPGPDGGGSGVGDHDPTPAAGTIEPPAGDPGPAGDEAAREAYLDELRQAGCICSDPFEEFGREETCPIKGHGIPF